MVSSRGCRGRSAKMNRRRTGLKFFWEQASSRLVSALRIGAPPPNGEGNRRPSSRVCVHRSSRIPSESLRALRATAPCAQISAPSPFELCAPFVEEGKDSFGKRRMIFRSFRRTRSGDFPVVLGLTATHRIVCLDNGEPRGGDSITRCNRAIRTHDGGRR